MGISYRKHHLYPESILVRDFTGKVGVQDIIKSWDYIIEHKLIEDTTKGVINNLSACDLQMNLESFDTLIAYLKEQKQLSSLKLAVICDNPRTIVFPTLGEAKERSLQIKPFSTMEAARNWVLNEH